MADVVGPHSCQSRTSLNIERQAMRWPILFAKLNEAIQACHRFDVRVRFVLVAEDDVREIGRIYSVDPCGYSCEGNEEVRDVVELWCVRSSFVSNVRACIALDST